MFPEPPVDDKRRAKSKSDTTASVTCSPRDYNYGTA
jgi:hypothetical protein